MLAHEQTNLYFYSKLTKVIKRLDASELLIIRLIMQWIDQHRVATSRIERSQLK